MLLMVTATMTMLESVSVTRRSSSTAAFNGLGNAINSVTLEDTILVGCDGLHAIGGLLLCGEFLPIDYPGGGRAGPHVDGCRPSETERGTTEGLD